MVNKSEFEFIFFEFHIEFFQFILAITNQN